MKLWECRMMMTVSFCCLHTQLTSGNECFDRNAFIEEKWCKRGCQNKPKRFESYERLYSFLHGLVTTINIPLRELRNCVPAGLSFPCWTYELIVPTEHCVMAFHSIVILALIAKLTQSFCYLDKDFTRSNYRSCNILKLLSATGRTTRRAQFLSPPSVTLI